MRIETGNELDLLDRWSGADDRYQEIQAGELLDGRWFTPAELVSGSNVVVLDENAAHKLFGRESILDKEIKVGGRPRRSIGLYAQPATSSHCR